MKWCLVILILLILLFLLFLVILMRGQIIGGNVYSNKWRITNWLSRNLLWFPAINNRTNTYFKDFLFLYWTYLHWSTQLITDSGTHPFLHPYCHHNITFCKINLKITYPRPYRRLVCDFKRANISSIRKSIKMVD